MSYTRIRYYFCWIGFLKQVQVEPSSHSLAAKNAEEMCLWVKDGVADDPAKREIADDPADDDPQLARL